MSKNRYHGNGDYVNMGSFGKKFHWQGTEFKNC